MTQNVPSPESPQAGPSWVPAARLLRPQGRRGELLAEPLSDLPGLFIPGRSISVARTATTAPFDTVLESCWSPTGRNAGRVVLKLAGIDSISAAELLAGRDLLVPASELPKLGDDTWFVRDLIGCQLFNAELLVGEITGVEYPMSSDGRSRLPDAAPLLEVTTRVSSRSNQEASDTKSPDTSEPTLIPFLKAWLESVDLEHRRLVMHLPDGLLDVNQPGSD